MSSSEAQQLAESLLEDDGPGISDLQHSARVQELASEIQCAIDTWMDAHQEKDAGQPAPPSICPECDGKGYVIDAPNRVLDGGTYQVQCEECKGTGKQGELRS
jgi:DnaJ-class molecular chaperone